VAQDDEQNPAQPQQPQQAQPDPMVKDQEEPAKPKRKIPPFAIIGVVALLLIIGGLFYWHSTYYEDTDDASIAGDIDQLSPRINGQITAVDIVEDQTVQAGQLLVEIDPRDYQTALTQAQAVMASKLAAWQAAKQDVPVQSTSSSSGISSADADVKTSSAQIDQAQKQLEAAQAAVTSAKANAHKTDLDLERYKPLVEKDVISKQQFDQAVAAADANNAALNQAQANELAQQQAVRVAKDRLLQTQAAFRNAQSGPTQVAIQESKASQAEADYMEAKAKYEQAQLNLSYTKIYAPYAGIITKKNVEPGQNASAGQSLMTLVSLSNLWVLANFKETQLRHMHAGQDVEVKVDAYGRKYSGKVTQIGGATGSLLSLFPPENATGNYVKVVQRVPVRIDFTRLEDENKDKLLRPGLSCEPTVKVK
jgi:membrane fusion protein (multidrug efflux system)